MISKESLKVKDAYIIVFGKIPEMYSVFFGCGTIKNFISITGIKDTICIYYYTLL